MSLLFNVKKQADVLTIPSKIVTHLEQNNGRAVEIFADLSLIYGAENVKKNPVLYFEKHFVKLMELCESPLQLDIGTFTPQEWIDIFFGKKEAFPQARYNKCIALSINLGNYDLIAEASEYALSLALKIATKTINSNTVAELVKKKDKIPVEYTKASLNYEEYKNIPDFDPDLHLVYDSESDLFSWHDALFVGGKLKHNYRALDIIFSNLAEQLFKSEDLLMDSLSQTLQSDDVNNLQVFINYVPDVILERHSKDCEWAVKAALSKANREALLLLATKACFAKYVTPEEAQKALESISFTCFNSHTHVKHVQFLMERWGKSMPYDFVKGVTLRFAYFGDKEAVNVLLLELARRTNEADDITIKRDHQLIVAQLKESENNKVYEPSGMTLVATTPNHVDLINNHANPLLTSWAVSQNDGRAAAETSAAATATNPDLETGSPDSSLRP